MWIVLLKVICAVIFAFLYALGGMFGTYIRRYLAPVWLGTCLFFFSGCSSMSFITAILVSSGLHLGYGASNIWIKYLKRLLYGFTNGTFSASQMFYQRQWLVGVFQVVMFTGICIVFGVYNPVSARAEEMFMGLMLGLLPLLAVKKQEA